ncbi:PaaI family thioesterase [Phaeobacter gallaeciensis]|uniref:Thioesterase domain-containing protein n=1 Tax=Phaeobacter gallaeciensis TaxID=60890 RepID=A0AAD0EBH2_9RHOB|nr:PaaI family thioesterase [Phaeobacter gallaeciensis]AHD09708.1 putative domain protein 1 [Phaeobacter gallaeciensis DSM 26640]ATE92972.1 thioesterase domain-containing protein [Phaeobacter gallaeciensis]ATE97206.1 thioesterase domain-containing protein [Phaeobacter gallaeciensis]ATF01637.1 thioesterase domain-containing protein [Phaeobacter gallaeciensis]ATF06017.1 thioesterase domain-containing protein [Phaeobacter gallaeciensis]
MGLAFDAEGLDAYLHEVFAEVANDFAIDRLDEEGITMRLLVDERHLRPGGTISGPSMFGLADVTVYALVLSRLGRKALAVTTNASFDFMRKPVGGIPLVAEGKLLKLGRQLAVGDVLLFSEGDPRPVARSTMTYAIPPER